MKLTLVIGAALALSGCAELEAMQQRQHEARVAKCQAYGVSGGAALAQCVQREELIEMQRQQNFQQNMNAIAEANRVQSVTTNCNTWGNNTRCTTF